MTQHLVEGFEYDLWANLAWFDQLTVEGWPEPKRAIFAHILSAQKVWLNRLEGVLVSAMPTVDLQRSEVEALAHGWIRQVKELAEDQVIEFRRLNGEPMALTVSEIARHVVNHGTYHRGELRGLARAEGSDAFPETDLVRYVGSASR